MNIKGRGTEERAGYESKGAQDRLAITRTGEEERLNIKGRGVEEREGIKETGAQQRAGIRETGSEERLNIGARGKDTRETMGYENRLKAKDRANQSQYSKRGARSF